METLHPGRAGNICVSCATFNKMIVSTFIRNVFYSITEGFLFVFAFCRNEGVAWRGSLISPEEDRAKKERQHPFCCLSSNYSSVGECVSCLPFIPLEGHFPLTVRDTLLLNQ